MAFPRFLLKSVGFERGEHGKRDRASPACLGTDRLVCVCGRGRYVYRCMCLLCVCTAVRTRRCCACAGSRTAAKAMPGSLRTQGAKREVAETVAGCSPWHLNASLTSTSLMSVAEEVSTEPQKHSTH